MNSVLDAKFRTRASLRPYVDVVRVDGRELRRTTVRASVFNPLKPNDHYTIRTAPLPSKRCILYIY